MRLVLSVEGWLQCNDWSDPRRKLDGGVVQRCLLGDTRSCLLAWTAEEGPRGYSTNRFVPCVWSTPFDDSSGPAACQLTICEGAAVCVSLMVQWSCPAQYDRVWRLGKIVYLLACLNWKFPYRERLCHSWRSRQLLPHQRNFDLLTKKIVSFQEWLDGPDRNEVMR